MAMVGPGPGCRRRPVAGQTGRMHSHGALEVGEEPSRFGAVVLGLCGGCGVGVAHGSGKGLFSRVIGHLQYDFKGIEIGGLLHGKQLRRLTVAQRSVA